MAQATFQVVVRTLSGQSLDVSIADDAPVAVLMLIISENFIIEIDGHRVHHSLLLDNFVLNVILPTGPEEMDDEQRRLGSYGIANDMKVFMVVKPFEVWELLFDFLRRNSYNIVSAEKEFGGRDACVPIWTAGFNHVLEHPDEQGSHYIQRTCVEWFEITVDYYRNAAAEGCQYAHEQLLTLEEHFYGRKVEFVDEIIGRAWVVILGE